MRSTFFVVFGRISFFVCILGCQLNGVEPVNKGTAGLKYKMDGSFDEWVDYKIGWKETGAEGVRQPEDVDIKEFFYHNDDTYLYLFFKCRPTIQERYSKGAGSGIFSYLYVDSDSDKSTGASKNDDAGNAAMLGADIRIWVPIGVYSTSKAEEGTQKGCSVSYEMKRWNSATRDFTLDVRQEDSHRGSLIGHGKDGVEMAFLLSDLKKRKGDQFDFICLEWANNKPEFANRIRIKLD